MPVSLEFRRKKRAFVRRVGSTTAQKALALAKRNRRKIAKVEIKNFDTKLNVADMDVLPTIVQLTNIAQGNTTITRDGAQCTVIGIDFRYFVRINTIAVASIVRVMLVLDRQTNQLVYGIADLMEDSSIRDNIVSPMNLDNNRRFQILYDRVHSLSINGVRGAFVRKFIKKDIVLRYDASTPAIADLTQNSLSLVHMSDEIANFPVLTTSVRLRFLDK